MFTSDLDYTFPQDLIAQVPSHPCRVAFVAPAVGPEELNIDGLRERFAANDLLVVNETKVIPARVFSANEVEVLFLRALTPNRWEVLFPAREFNLGDSLSLPQDLTLTLEQKGLPQTVRLSRPLTPEYFAQHGEMALPPYIQEARGQRHNRAEDQLWYQTAWARQAGSVAAPTASLHFQRNDLELLQRRGIKVAKLTLHVGAGTFLPVKTADLGQHAMHAEQVEISQQTLQQLAQAKERGGKVWALGTTVTRALESMARGRLELQADGSQAGATQLFIYPPYEFQVVDRLLTNFHQPRSTLLALVAAFAGLDSVRSVYAWAIERRFRLFSYGDLSAWIKP